MIYNYVAEILTTIFLKSSITPPENLVFADTHCFNLTPHCSDVWVHAGAL